MHNCTHLMHQLMYGAELDPNGSVTEIHDRIFAKQAFELCIANSRFMCDELIKRYGVPAQRMRVVYPGYRPQQFNMVDRERYRKPVRKELGAQESVLIGLVTSGNFDIRGLDILLEAFAGLP